VTLPGAIDAYVNVRMGSTERPEWLVRVAEDYFKRPEAIFKDFTSAEMIEAMDAAGVKTSVLTLSSDDADPEVLAFASNHPDRFRISVYVDPRRGMKAVRELASLAANENVCLARMVPFMSNTLPNAAPCWPIYAKCVELGLPISVNTGIPGPPAPARGQDPILLDDVCLFFPELVLIMAHGADPWWNVAIRLMLKYRNLYLMTSAFAPRYYPPELLRFMNTRGRSKILFASDHPVLSMERCMREAANLDLRDGVLQAFLHDNAARVLKLAPPPTEA
jgi:predicted TIM-barrel fold metal-dependent hydrolase